TRPKAPTAPTNSSTAAGFIEHNRAGRLLGPILRAKLWPQCLVWIGLVAEAGFAYCVPQSGEGIAGRGGRSADCSHYVGGRPFESPRRAAGGAEERRGLSDQHSCRDTARSGQRQ